MKRLAPAWGLALMLSGTCACAQDAHAPAATSTAVERGRYLANAGNCVSCHTRPGGQPLAGGVPFETPFGTVYSTNITQDRETGIGRWTEADLGRAMREGVSRDGSSLIPAFPYTSFTKVSGTDIADIYAYLRTVPAVRYSAPDDGPLLRLRWGVALWKALFFSPGRYVADPSKPQEWNRGAYLVQGLGHCDACHTPRAISMAERNEAAYTGGAFQERRADGHVGRWYAVDLTTDKHGLGSWSVTDLDKYLRTGMSARAGTFGPMNEVIVNSLKLLTPADVHAMAVYVKSLAGAPYAGPRVPADLVAAGAGIYKERCEKCHGASGRGGFFAGPPLAGSAVVQGEDPASLIDVILHGPTLAKGVSYGSWESMLEYADVLSDAEIAAVSNFVRGSWGNEAGPVKAADVRAAR
jgi:mono/diheme cytochrome c family protein